MRTTAVTGQEGQQYAEAYLRRAAYTILARNFRTRAGEIDLIARSAQGCVAFIEVKTRATDAFAQACEFVTVAKQKRLIAAAGAWMQENQSEQMLRFDVIEVYWPKQEATPVRCNHIIHAFEC